jgi:hypothetical protein
LAQRKVFERKERLIRALGMQRWLGSKRLRRVVAPARLAVVVDDRPEARPQTQWTSSVAPATLSQASLLPTDSR